MTEPALTNINKSLIILGCLMMNPLDLYDSSEACSTSTQINAFSGGAGMLWGIS
jgi:hypothetical protein